MVMTGPVEATKTLVTKNTNLDIITKHDINASSSMHFKNNFFCLLCNTVIFQDQDLAKQGNIALHCASN